MNISEQRRESRHRGKIPVYRERGLGITRNFSVSGIYFETDRSFSSEETIEFAIILKHAKPDRPLRVQCLGEIVRVEESGPKVGVASAIHSCSLEEMKDSDPQQG